jgi:Beta-lactamase class C and other penicillin binding proteins
MDESRLGERLSSVAAELSGLSVVVLRDRAIAYEGYFGRSYIDPDHPELDRPVTADTRFRIASISKTFTALGAMRLVDRGLLDLEADVSDYLGFSLRNPHWPSEAITSAMLLSHSSSLRDGGGYSLSAGHRLAEFFSPGFDAYEGGAHFAAPERGGEADREPGAYYEYCNLGYGVLATAIENISGQRFDEYMRVRVLSPLGLSASYNVLTLPDAAFANLAPLYRKGRGGESWDPEGPWLPQVDDYRGLRPAPLSGIEGYAPGTNGTLFSPQGGLRASCREIARLATLLMGGDALGDTELVSPNVIARMESVAWSYDPRGRNGFLDDGDTRATGLGLVRTTNSVDELGGDALLSGGRGPCLWGHHADAYGLRGGMLFDSETGFGLVYLIGGLPDDPTRHRGSHYSRSIWEERIMEAIVEEWIGG